MRSLVMATVLWAASMWALIKCTEYLLEPRENPRQRRAQQRLRQALADAESAHIKQPPNHCA